MRHALVLALVFGSTAAFADEIHLRNGGRLIGDIRERRPDAVVIETGPGLVTVPTSQVARVVTSDSALATYRQRAARLRANDAEGWFELALWAQDQGLNTQARQALDHVLTIHPNHSGAHQAAGHVFQDGRWMTPEQSYRARGLVPFEGSWVTPADRQAMLTRACRRRRGAPAARRERRPHTRGRRAGPGGRRGGPAGGRRGRRAGHGHRRHPLPLCVRRRRPDLRGRPDHQRSGHPAYASPDRHSPSP